MKFWNMEKFFNSPENLEKLCRNDVEIGKTRVTLEKKIEKIFGNLQI